METRRWRWIGWLAWGTAWGLLFAALVLFLPPVPSSRFTGLGPLRVEGFTDPQTLVVSLVSPGSSVAPRSFALIDLQRGTLRRLDLPFGHETASGNDAEAPPNRVPAGLAAPPRPRATPVFGPATSVPMRIVSDLGRPRGGLPPCRVVGERLILVDPLVDQVLVGIWNSRTGEQVFDRVYPWCDTWVIGNRLAIEWSEPQTGLARLELLDLATGEIISTRLPAQQVSLGRGRASPNGRLFIDDFKAGQIRVWALGSGEELFRADADQYGLSPDSRWLATISSPRRRPSFRRGSSTRDSDEWPKLRIYDLATGSVLAERQYPFPPPAGWVNDESILTFHDNGQCLAITGRMVQGVRRETDLWRWPEGAKGEFPEPAADEIDGQGAIRRVSGILVSRPVSTESIASTDGNTSTTDRWGYLVDGTDVIHPETGERVSELPDGGQWVSGTAGWGVIRAGRQSPSDDVADLVAPWSGLLASVISHQGEPFLCDLATGRRIAWLGGDVAGLQYSPDARWLVTQSRDSLDIWSLPPTRAWSRAFFITLMIMTPVLCSLIWRRTRMRSHAIALPT